jgi:hypothetical protein
MVGRPEMGRDLIVTQLGEMSAQQVQARLLAGGHSLMSKSWLAIGQEGAVYLADNLARVARVLARADFSIVYTLSCPPAGFSLAYHFSEGAVFEHKIEQGVIHRVTELPDSEGVVAGGLAFFGVQDAPDADRGEIRLPAAALDDIRSERDQARIACRLADCGVSQDVAQALATDLAGSVARGSALRVQYGADGRPTSDRGLLLLRAAGGMWLARPEANGLDRGVAVRRCDRASFREEVSALL